MAKPLRLTGYGGVGEIGGNAFVLDDGTTQLALDFGMQFGGPSEAAAEGRRLGQNDFFDAFVKPRSERWASDLMALGLLPPRPEWYRPDEGGTGTRPLDAVLLSHPHADHWGYIPYLAKPTPIHMSRVSAFTLASVQATGQTLASSQVVNVKERGTRNSSKKTEPRLVDERPILADDRFQVGAWQVERFAVDHSIHGAGGYILEGHGVRIAYSGDLRLHGRHPERSERFLKAAAGCDVFLIEGTRVGHDHRGGDKRERDVEDEIAAVREAAPDEFIALSYPPRDLDRFKSLYEARGDRVLVISEKQAHLIHHLRQGCDIDLPDPLSDPGLRIHAPAGTTDVERWDDPQPRVPGISDWAATLYFKHFQENRVRPENTVTNEQLRREPGAYMLTLSYWNIQELIDILPAGRKNGVYIRSQTQPFNDEMLVQDEKLGNWLDHFGLRVEQTHVSGHMSQDDVFRAIESIRPKKLVPIHSEHPELTLHNAQGVEGVTPLPWVHGQTLDL